MIQRITVHTIYQSMIRFHGVFLTTEKYLFRGNVKFWSININMERTKKNLPELYPSSTMFDNFFSIKKNVHVSVHYQFQISCVIKHIKRKADKWTTNQHICLFMKNSYLIVFGKVIFTKQCLLHLSRVDTCIFISFTFKSHIYNVHLVKSELKLGGTITNMPNNSTIFICIYISSFLLTSFRNTSAHP